MKNMNNRPQMRILLAEDNLATGRLYKKILEENGFVVDHAVDGDQALFWCQQGGYTLILMDIRMPKRDGLQVLEELQLNPAEVKNGPIVMLTNLTDDALVKKAMGFGAMSYMDKSNLNPEQLVEKVNGVLGLPNVE